MRRKITDKKGATLIFAMVIFLIATIISLTIVSIAVTNISKVKRQREEQQATLAISSAAKYVQHLFDGCSYYYEKDGDDRKGVLAYGGSELGKLVKTSEVNEKFGNDLKGIIEENIEKVIPSNSPEIVWYITATGLGEGDNDALGVKIASFLDDKNNIVTRISKGDTAEKDVYSLTLVFTVNTFTDENGNPEYTWSYSYIDRLTNIASGGESSG